MRWWRPQARTRRTAERRRRRVDQFRIAWQSGDAPRMVRLLRSDASLVIDGGGLVSLETSAADGAPAVVSMLERALAACPDAMLTVRSVNGQPGIVAQAYGRVVAVVAANFTRTSLSRLWVIANPEKLAHWNVDR